MLEANFIRHVNDVIGLRLNNYVPSWRLGNSQCGSMLSSFDPHNMVR